MNKKTGNRASRRFKVFGNSRKMKKNDSVTMTNNLTHEQTNLLRKFRGGK